MERAFPMIKAITSHLPIDDYLDLVRDFPLRKLRNDREHAQALKILTQLLGRPHGNLSYGQRSYAEGLALFVKEYEDRVYPFPRKKQTPLQILRSLMRDHQMNTQALGKIMGNRTAASLVLNGKRELSKSHIRRLATWFRVDPGIFF
jgi:HTH-type transcriptional regulator / antitoxin HigA